MKNEKIIEGQITVNFRFNFSDSPLTDREEMINYVAEVLLSELKNQGQIHQISADFETIVFS